MRALHPTILGLGLVSFLTDFSSEMIYPLLPLFLSQTLGAGPAALGIIEGIAEATAAFFKFISGRWSDEAGRKKPFVVAGYSLSSLSRPLIGLAQAWPHVLVLRFLDRIGKGIRTSPRDALIADLTNDHNRGRAYGFHRAMDHAGAVIGPLAAAVLLGVGFSLRETFLFAAVPAALCMVVLVYWVREPARVNPDGRAEAVALKATSWKALPADFKRYLFVVLLFTLGNATDAFFLLKLGEAGVPQAWVAGLWAVHSAVKMSSTYLGGVWSDRFKPKNVLCAGWLFYACIYVAFAYVTDENILVGLFLLYGIYFGLTEPAERSLVVIQSKRATKGVAFGFFHLFIAAGALPASLVFGLIWQSFGSHYAFLMGASLAFAATLALAFLVRDPEAR
ncbi:MAG TPA: MFS transporter [Bdellovibrionales bacterium]|nr:MFS transporter [Bdellovibrionales bacterium]